MLIRFLFWLGSHLRYNPRRAWLGLHMATFVLAAVVAYAGLSCVQTYDTVRVAVVDCPEPQRGWIVAGVQNLDALGITFRVVDTTGAPQVTAYCADLSSPAPAGGRYTLGTDAVSADPVYAPGEFGITAAINHELVHWYINRRGRHPERTRYHVCRYQDETSLCWPETYSRTALMVPSLGTGAAFNPGFDTVDVGDIPQNAPQDVDRRFVDWATGRAP